jgi:predicted ATPase/class 3 adenylate cyclase
MARIGQCRLTGEGVAAVQKRYRVGRWVNIAAFCSHVGIARSTYYELIGRNVWFERATLEDKLAAIGIRQSDYEQFCEFKDREWDQLRQRAGSPESVCAYLVTDIEGDARLWDAYPEAMRAAIARHDAILHQAIQDHQGRSLKLVGGGACAVFVSASDSLAAALTSQRALLVETWPLQTPLRVRMALHVGVVEPKDADRFGPALHRAARLLSIGHGGQILLTQIACEAVHDHLPEGTTLKDLHSHRLQDIQQPEHVWQLLHPTLPTDFPPLRSLQGFANNLPQQPTSFIGRTLEVAQVKELLNQTRLLTLVGAGGSGKTRLSLRAAADLLAAYPDGVWQIELASLTDASLVVQTLASALGLREQPGQTLMQTLTEFLQPRTALLLLDNCEHLIASCAHLATDLLGACPNVTLLATSREALRVAGEVVWQVPPLSQPDAERLRRVEAERMSALLASDAVRLFVERAQAQRSDFGLNASNGALVAEVCRRLDGIPLAIELAAARLRTMTVEQLLQRLDHCFQVLTGGQRTAPPRQQTLRALIDWSYDLLEASEKALLGRLSVFSGGWTLEAAMTVCAGEEIEDWEVLDLLTSLADKSLVVFEERSDVGRYRLLETIGQYAGDRLVETSEAKAWHRRHRDYFLMLANEIRPKLRGAEAVHWLKVLDAEHDNLRQALMFCLAEEDGESGLQLSAALQWFWQIRGHLSEGRERMAAVLQHPANRKHTTERANVLNASGLLAWIQGDYAAARTVYEEGLEIFRELKDQRGVSVCLGNLGSMARTQGDYELARLLQEESLAICRELKDGRGISASLMNLANLAAMQGDYAAARPLYEESLTIKREMGDRLGLAYTLHNLGNLAYEQKDYASARSLQEESLTICRELKDRRGISICLGTLGAIASEQRDDALAHSLLSESLTICRDLGDKGEILRSLEAFAGLSAAREQPERAAQLWGAAEALRTAIGSPLTGLQRESQTQKIEKLRETLGVETFLTAWEKGNALTMEAAIDLAQEGLNA